jgi:hypothetical protein
VVYHKGNSQKGIREEGSSKVIPQVWSANVGRQGESQRGVLQGWPSTWFPQRGVTQGCPMWGPPSRPPIGGSTNRWSRGPPLEFRQGWSPKYGPPRAATKVFPRVGPPWMCPRGRPQAVVPRGQPEGVVPRCGLPGGVPEGFT